MSQFFPDYLFGANADANGNEVTENSKEAACKVYEFVCREQEVRRREIEDLRTELTRQLQGEVKKREEEIKALSARFQEQLEALGAKAPLGSVYSAVEQVKCETDDCKPDKDSAEFILEPGRIGWIRDDSGVVTSVITGEQAHVRGIQPGMRITSVNGKAYSTAAVREAAAGSKSYKVAMVKVIPDQRNSGGSLEAWAKATLAPKQPASNLVRTGSSSHLAGPEEIAAAEATARNLPPTPIACLRADATAPAATATKTTPVADYPALPGDDNDDVVSPEARAATFRHHQKPAAEAPAVDMPAAATKAAVEKPVAVAPAAQEPAPAAEAKPAPSVQVPAPAVEAPPAEKPVAEAKPAQSVQIPVENVSIVDSWWQTAVKKAQTQQPDVVTPAPEPAASKEAPAAKKPVAEAKPAPSVQVPVANVYVAEAPAVEKVQTDQPDVVTTAPEPAAHKEASVGVVSSAAASGGNIAAGAGKEKPWTVSFAVTCSNTRVGLHIRVVGSLPQLGEWNTARGLPLHTCASDFPWWRAANDVPLEDGVEFQYKYVICNDLGGESQWETGATNRTMHVPTASSNIQRRRVELKEQFDDISSEPLTMMSRNASIMCFDNGVDRGDREDATMVREDSYSQLYGDCDLVPPPRGSAVEQTTVQSGVFQTEYKLIGQGPLGAGTYGLVWRCSPLAKSSKHGAHDVFAAKLIRKDRLSTMELGNLVGTDGEIELHERCRHPNIVALCEHFNEDKTVSLVLEYCRGGDLFDAVVKSGTGFTEAGARTAARHLLMALQYLHGESIVHRDIKCENLLLANADVPPEANIFKLCDFGFAAVDRGHGFTQRLGSPDTVAPEVLSCKKYSFSADNWSAGVVTYMMLVAESPFASQTETATLKRVLAGQYSVEGKFWTRKSPECKNVIKALMNFEVERRAPASEVLQHPWFRVSAPMDGH